MVLPAMQEDLEVSLVDDELEADGEDSLSFEEIKVLEAEKELSLRQQALITLFVLVNVLIFGLIANLSFFVEVVDNLELYVVYLSVIISLPLLYFSAKDVFVAAFERLKAKICSYEVNVALALVIGAIGLVVSLFLGIDTAIIQKYCIAFLGALFTFSLFRYLVFLYHSKLESVTDFRLWRLGSRLRLVVDEESSSEEAEPEWKNIEDIRAGDKVQVEAGDYLLCDSLIIKGACEVKERRYGGVETVRFKSPGQELFAGSQIINGSVACKVINSFSDSRITNFTEPFSAKLEELEGVYSKSEKESSYANIFVLFTAACAGIYWHEQGAHLGHISSVVSAVLFVSVLSLLLYYLPVWKRVVLSSIFLTGALVKELDVLQRLSKIKTLVIDYLKAHPYNILRISDFQIVDDRIEEQNLVPVLLSLLGNSDNPVDIAATQFLRGRVDTAVLHEVKDFYSYLDLGVAGVVNDTEFSIGCESFLIERGVQLQQSEIEPEEEGVEWVYIAIHTELVAKYRVSNYYLHDGEGFASDLKRLGVKCMLCSQDTDAEALDLVGKKIGLELVDIHADLSQQDYITQLQNTPEAALFVRFESNPDLVKQGYVSISSFDELKWNIDSADVTLFGSDCRLIASLLAYAKKYFQIQKLSIIGSLIIGFLVLVLASAGYLSALGAFSSVFALLTVFAFNSFRLLPKNPF